MKMHQIRCQDLSCKHCGGLAVCVLIVHGVPSNPGKMGQMPFLLRSLSGLLETSNSKGKDNVHTRQHTMLLASPWTLMKDQGSKQVEGTGISAN